MKINFDLPIINPKTKKAFPSYSPEGKIEGDMLLADIAYSALISAKQDKPESQKTKRNKYKLAKKIVDGGEIELSSDEMVLLKETIGETIISPIIMGEALDLIEPEVNEE